MIQLALPLLLALSNPVVPSTLEGSYLEVRTCDVYTGPCFANGEVGSLGKEATIGWRFDRGAVAGVDVSGLSVVAVVRASATLGDPYGEPLPASTRVYVDAKGSQVQQSALRNFAKSQLGTLATEGTLRVATIDLSVGCCDKKGCADLAVNGDEVVVKTRCLCDDDIHCGNESIYYPPLTEGVDVIPAVASRHTLQCEGTDLRLTDHEVRGAFVGRFKAAAAQVAERPSALSHASLAKDGYRIERLPTEMAKPEASAEETNDKARTAPKLPEEIVAPFAAELDPNGLRVWDGEDILYDLWFRKELPLNEKPLTMLSINFPMIPAGSFVGVVRSYGEEVDYRESDLERGFYVMRYAIQPQDGDHLGTAPSRDFVLLTSFEQDKKLDPITDADHLSDLAIEASSVDHPLVCYLIKPAGDAPSAPTITKHEERDEWVADISLKGKKPGADKSETIRLGLVLIGFSEHF